MMLCCYMMRNETDKQFNKKKKIPHNVTPEILVNKHKHQEQYKFRHSYIVDNKVPIHNIYLDNLCVSVEQKKSS